MAIQSQGLRQVQKQTQNLVLAPQLRQSLKILQVPALELRSAILEELQTNPLLEELGNNDESLDANEVEPSPDEIESEKTDEFSEENSGEPESKEKDTDSESDGVEDLQDLDFTDEFAILKEMEEDLREHYENEFDGEAKLGNTDAQDKRKFFFDSLTSEVSLQEHLIDQLKLTEVTSEVRNAAEYLIGSLDENGFLNSNLSDISLISLMPLADLQEALATLQTFEPIGIASIDLQDCLLRQMDARGWEETDQYTIVKDYFSLLVRRRVPELSRKLSQPTEIIHEAIEKG
jgi:RNA polymerase sigma-54 factor